MKVKINILPQTFILAAAWILILPVSWIAAALAAGCIHELGHLICLKLTGTPVFAVSIGTTGAVIMAEPQSAPREMICAAGGPAASFALILISKYFPLVAIFGIVQGLYNMIPIYPNDGGRMLRCLLKILTPSHYIAVENVVVYTAAFIIICGGMCYVWHFPDQFWQALLAIFLILRPLGAKFPCKESAMRVQ